MAGSDYSQLEKLEREREVLSRKIAEEKKRLAAKLDGDLVRVLGESGAAKHVANLAEAARKERLDAVCEAIDGAFENAASTTPRKANGERFTDGAGASA